MCLDCPSNQNKTDFWPETYLVTCFFLRFKDKTFDLRLLCRITTQHLILLMPRIRIIDGALFIQTATKDFFTETFSLFLLNFMSALLILTVSLYFCTKTLCHFFAHFFAQHHGALLIQTANMDFHPKTSYHFFAQLHWWWKGFGITTKYVSKINVK